MLQQLEEFDEKLEMLRWKEKTSEKNLHQVFMIKAILEIIIVKGLITS
jgi:hypothetical protein